MEPPTPDCLLIVFIFSVLVLSCIFTAVVDMEL